MYIRTKVEKTLAKRGYVIGCWDNKMEELSVYMVNKLLNEIYESSTDVKISIKRKPHVVEVSFMDGNEVDFNILTKVEYIIRYGNDLYMED